MSASGSANWPESAMDGSEYKNVRNVFEQWSEATVARRVSAMDGSE